jgi:acetyl-CoA carboxylase beta subunit
MAEEWRGLTDSDKERYQKMAVIDKERYAKEKKVYESKKPVEVAPKKEKKEKVSGKKRKAPMQDAVQA